MKVSELEQEILDLDWFGTDEVGAIARFTTGGRGMMPAAAASSAEDLETLQRFLENELPSICTAICNPSIDRYATFRNNEDKNRYVSEACRMSSRGLYCYDCMISRVRPTGYFRISKPSRPLTFAELPLNIQQVLERTRLNGISFSVADTITVDSLR